VTKKRVCSRFVLLTIFGLLCLAPAYAQGCSLCRAQTASETSRFIAALRGGIWILIVPSLSVCIALAAMAYRRRNRFHEDDAESDSW